MDFLKIVCIVLIVRHLHRMTPARHGWEIDLILIDDRGRVIRFKLCDAHTSTRVHRFARG